MRRRLILAAASAALLLAGPLTAQSGPYDVEVNRGAAGLVAIIQNEQIRGVPLADGSEGFAFLFEREKSQVRGNFIFPAPDPKADPVLPAEYVGCIAVFKGTLFDFGCEVQSPSHMEIDPALSETSMAFTVLSAQPGGFRLSATVVLSGQGEPSPVQSQGAALSPEPPERPAFAIAQGVAYLGRAAIASGAIRSDLVGGGAIKSSTSVNGSMIRGAFDFAGLGAEGLEVRPGVAVSIETEKIVCLGTPPDVTCYPF